jgi:hypothetical protein
MISRNHINSIYPLFNNHHHPYIVLCVQILVAAFVQSVRGQLEINVASPADSADTSVKDAASRIQVVKGNSPRAVIQRYADPLDSTKYYRRDTDSAGNVNFFSHQCPNNLVFNPATQQCSLKADYIKHPPELTYIKQTKCNGVLGYYCKSTVFTYCTHDNHKILDDMACPNSKPCRAEKTNPCIQ